MVSKVQNTLVALEMLTGTVRDVVQVSHARIFVAYKLRDDLLRSMNKLHIVLETITDDCHAVMSLSIYSNIHRTDGHLGCVIISLLHFMLNDQVVVFRKIHFNNYRSPFVGTQSNLFNVIDLLTSMEIMSGEFGPLNIEFID